MNVAIESLLIDTENDVLAAQRCGLTGVLVHTAKYLPEAAASASGTPDVVPEALPTSPHCSTPESSGFERRR